MQQINNFDFWYNVHYRNIMAILAFIYLLQNISFWLTFTLIISSFIYYKTNLDSDYFKNIIINFNSIFKGIKNL